MAGCWWLKYWVDLRCSVLVKKLLVLPLTFFLIAFFSGFFSVRYSFTFCPKGGAGGCSYTDLPSITRYTHWFLAILFPIGIVLWFRFNAQVKKLGWNRVKSPESKKHVLWFRFSAQVKKLGWNRVKSPESKKHD